MNSPKQSQAVRKIFSSEVSKTYELINHILTFGMDLVWRKRLARRASAAGGSQWCDLCTGTGETAVYLTKRAASDAKVYAVDFSGDMLAVAASKPAAAAITFVEANVRNLPFADNSFDVLTISFATRNINIDADALTASFREFHRILKPGGKFMNLETSQPRTPLIRRLFHLYIRLFVKIVGSSISGSAKAYAYLSHTIPRFYNAEELRSVLLESGFGEVVYESMMFGAAAIHCATKE